MAYRSTSGTANNTADFFSKFRSFVVDTVGWTMLASDLAVANPFLHLYSAGESGKETIYLVFDKFTATADKICVRQALWWNPDTSAFSQLAGTTGYNYIATKDATTFLYWIFADLDHIMVVVRIGTGYQGFYFGIVKRYWSSNIAITQADVSAGSSVVIPVDNATYFKAGLNYQIINRDKFERMQITATDIESNPNTITVASLANAYLAGARVGEDVAPVMMSRSDTALTTLHTPSRYGGWNTSLLVMSVDSSIGGAITNANNDCRYNLVGIFPYWVHCGTTDNRELRGQFIEVYETATNWGVSEDVVDAGNGITYKYFYIGAKGFAIRE